MNKLKLLYLFVAATCMLTFASCDKDKDAEPSQQRMLTASQWQGAEIYYNNDNFTAFFRDSLDFNIKELGYRFDDNGEYRQTFGRTILGTWEFEGADKDVILFDKQEQFEERSTINKLTDTELYLDVNWFGPPVELRFKRP